MEVGFKLYYLYCLNQKCCITIKNTAPERSECLGGMKCADGYRCANREGGQVCIGMCTILTCFFKSLGFRFILEPTVLESKYYYIRIKTRTQHYHLNCFIGTNTILMCCMDDTRQDWKLFMRLKLNICSSIFWDNNVDLKKTQDHRTCSVLSLLAQHWNYRLVV